jgi:peptide-methionine (S)-S-oxide reductase
VKSSLCVRFSTLLLTAFVLAACSSGESIAPSPQKPSADQASAVFAGGCFWCMEPPFDALPGVVSTTSGYAGGTLANPTYKQVTAGGSGHLEVVQVIYDPAQLTYEELLEVYWHNVDPLDAGGQFCDRGVSYQTAIFATNNAEQQAAERSKAQVAITFDAAIATQVKPLVGSGSATGFYPAEGYHQDYYQKNPLRYKYYRNSCGRDARLAQLWGDPAS